MYSARCSGRRRWPMVIEAVQSHVLLLFLLITLSLPSLSWQEPTLGERALSELSTSQINLLASSPNPTKNIDLSNPSSHLSKILIPRPSGTENNTLVKNYLVSKLKELKWDVEEDTFTSSTPYGDKNFTNVIATKDPDAPRRVIVSAHFDSKFFSTYPQNQFVGATDSAAPCAILLDLAETLDPLLEHRKERLEQGLIADEEVAETTLQVVFFDGEEAFIDWTATDSVYGARHLAEKWSTTYITPNTKRRMRPSATEISTVEHLILLDLLGAPNPTIRSYFLDTAWLFDGLVAAERRLASAGAFENPGQGSVDAGKWQSFFTPRTAHDVNVGFIDDDHMPFMKKGVSVLHLIANPFPLVWHTLKDDASALDLETMKRWIMIMRIFMCEYLGLEPVAQSTTVMRSAAELPLRSKPDSYPAVLTRLEGLSPREE